MKKVGETTRQFKYDLNQISDDYTVEVMNRSKELDLIDRMPEELWTEVFNIVQDTVTKIIPKKKESKKVKWLSEKGLQIAQKRSERQRRKVKTYPTVEAVLSADWKKISRHSMFQKRVSLLKTKSRDKVGTVSTVGLPPYKPGRVDSFHGFIANFCSLKTKKIPARRFMLGDWLGFYRVFTVVGILA